MHNSGAPSGLNTTLLIGLDLWNITLYDMYNNLHFYQILHYSKLVVPKFKIRPKLYT